MPEKGKVRKDVSGTRFYAGEERLSPYTSTNEYKRKKNESSRAGGSRSSYKKMTKNTRHFDINDFGGAVGYEGDHIGKIHIAALIPHFRRKKKRK